MLVVPGKRCVATLFRRRFTFTRVIRVTRLAVKVRGIPRDWSRIRFLIKVWVRMNPMCHLLQKLSVILKPVTEKFLMFRLLTRCRPSYLLMKLILFPFLIVTLLMSQNLTLVLLQVITRLIQLFVKIDWVVLNVIFIKVQRFRQ